MAKSLFKVTSKQVENHQEDSGGNNSYTTKINIPQYLPNCKKPHVTELCDRDKYNRLIYEIKKADIPADVKEFLLLAATRHIVFNYSKIADFYAHSDSKIQRLMEKSALVIIDFDDAIANGYVRFSKRIENIMKGSGERTRER